MEFIGSTELNSLSQLVRNFIVNKSLAATGAEPTWQSLYNLTKNNRIESCFIDLDTNQNTHLALCAKMLAKRGNVLAEREACLIDLHHNLNSVFASFKLTPVYVKGFALSLDDRIPKRLRFYEDVDLIIDPFEAQSYLDVLYANGYRLKPSAAEVDPLAVLKSMGSLNLLCSVSGSSIDIHVKPIWPYFSQIFDYQDLRAESRRMSGINGSHFLIPSLVQHSLILLIEGSKDLWFRVDKLLDFHTCYLSLTSAEVEEFKKILSRYKLNKMFEFSSFLLTNIFKMDKDITDRGLVREDLFCKFKNIVTDSWEFKINKNAPTEPYRTRVHLMLVPSKIRYLWLRAVLPTENDFRFFPCFSRVPFLFSFLRPLRILLTRFSRIILMFSRRLECW
jgi:hypothetical protein